MCVPLVSNRLTIPFNDGEEAHFAGPQSERASRPGPAGWGGGGSKSADALQQQYDGLKELAAGAAGQVQSMKSPFGDFRTPQGT